MEGNEVVIQIEYVSRQHYPLNTFTVLYTPTGARDRNKTVNFVKNFIFMNLANKASPGIFLLVSGCLSATQIEKKNPRLEMHGLSLESP
ncbi:hypothetical protein Y032_0023g750 [Ancylostoma ceylanicum]|uniref:Uncharacterized protein n=1 Tax=Ancylostoma ceylanicum TaxID=53326 RepID=A0A016UWN6_9BILA|nr:hypothetical protein Y032_0023g750 [Ancylostoma ceylanicum]